MPHSMVYDNNGSLQMDYVPGGDEWDFVEFQAAVNEQTIPLGREWGWWLYDGIPSNNRLEVWDFLPCSDWWKGRVSVDIAANSITVNEGVFYWWNFDHVADEAMRGMGWWRWSWRMAGVPLAVHLEHGLPRLWWGSGLAGKLREVLGVLMVYQLFEDRMRAYMLKNGGNNNGSQ